MRVIIQDTETKAYLSEKGRWVADIADASDFLTLLRAYHFAKETTSRNFEVLLHCLDDDYLASIIKGVGTANAEAAIDIAPFKPQTKWASRGSTGVAIHPRFTLDTFDSTRSRWN